jgi:hypothetical protein
VYDKNFPRKVIKWRNPWQSLVLTPNGRLGPDSRAGQPTGIATTWPEQPGDTPTVPVIIIDRCTTLIYFPEFAQIHGMHLYYG